MENHTLYESMYFSIVYDIKNSLYNNYSPPLVDVQCLP